MYEYHHLEYTAIIATKLKLIITRIAPNLIGPLNSGKEKIRTKENQEINFSSKMTIRHPLTPKVSV